MPMKTTRVLRTRSRERRNGQERRIMERFKVQDFNVRLQWQSKSVINSSYTRYTYQFLKKQKQKPDNKMFLMCFSLEIICSHKFHWYTVNYNKYFFRYNRVQTYFIIWLHFTQNETKLKHPKNFYFSEMEKFRFKNYIRFWEIEEERIFYIIKLVWSEHFIV